MLLVPPPPPLRPGAAPGKHLFAIQRQWQIAWIALLGAFFGVLKQTVEGSRGIDVTYTPLRTRSRRCRGFCSEV